MKYRSSPAKPPGRGERSRAPRAASTEACREEHLRLALEAGHMGTWEWDIPADEITVSGEFEKIHGREPGTFAGTFQAYQLDIHPCDRQRVLHAVSETLERGVPYRVEYRIVRPDGSLTWIRARGSLFGDAKGKPLRMIGVCADASDQRVAEAAIKATARSLARERERLAIALRSGQLGVYEWRVGDHQLWWSPEIYPLYGVDPATFTPTVQSFAQLIHPHDRDDFWRRTQASLERRDVFSHEYRIVRPDSAVRWIANYSRVGVDANGNAERITGVAMDITDRKHAEQRLGVLVSSIDDHLVTYDREWRFTFINDAAARILDRPRKELLGRCIWDVFPQAVGKQYYNDLHEAAREQHPVHSEHYYAPFDRWFQNHIYPSPDGVTVFATDITSRKRAEAALVEREEALRESDRRKDEFLAMLSHELRNPLAPIRNAITILEKIGPPMPAVKWAHDVINRQITQMTRLVDDLLDVSRITRGKIELRRQRVELQAIVNDAVEASRPLIEQSRHRLAVDVPPEPVWIDADPVRLAQVLLNLLNNAAKYTEPGGRIELSARREDEDLVIRLKDSGVGIPRDMLPHIFEMFAQVDHSIDRSQGGIGIGLTLVERIVALHGGRVEALSDGPGHGSEFIVRLPLPQGESGTTSTKAIDAGSDSTHAANHRILVVDDNDDAAESMAMYLGMIGHDVRTAHDGLAAVEEAVAFRPSVILLDIGLPKLNGYDAAKRIRKQCEGDVILIALTGWGQDEDRRRSREAGFDHHLTKPVDFDRLNALLSRTQWTQKEGAQDSIASHPVSTAARELGPGETPPR